MASPEAFSRHDWVWLAADWAAHLRSPLDRISTRQMGHWLDNGRPLVVARRLADDRGDDLRLGLALPGRRRISLHLNASAITRRSSPPGPAEVKGVAPPTWQSPLDWLAATAESLAPSMGVYGSLAWQYFAQEQHQTYVTATSDIDLVVRPSDRDTVERLLAAFGRYESLFDGPRLDGEMVFPDGGAVAWRELAARPDKVLSKSIDAVAMRPVSTLMALFERRVG